jgi:hypothetical protein
MKRVNVDAAAESVKQFVRNLPVNVQGLELELDGKIVCEVIAPRSMSTVERAALVARVRQRAKKSRERNAGISARVIEREIQQAVEQVRRRKKA